MCVPLCGHADPLDRPSLAVRQIVHTGAGKEPQHVATRLSVVQVVDLRFQTGRIGTDPRPQRDRQINDMSHRRSSHGDNLMPLSIEMPLQSCDDDSAPTTYRTWQGGGAVAARAADGLRGGSTTGAGVHPGAPKAYRFDPPQLPSCMPLLLHLDSSMDIEHSRSRAITRTFANTWRAFSPDHKVVYRDLYRDPPPHLNDMALHWPSTSRARPGIQLRCQWLQQNLLDELLAADALLIDAALYNFSFPSTLSCSTTFTFPD